eukprot:5398640-Amphidinium_carterae.2
MEEDEVAIVSKYVLDPTSKIRTITAVVEEQKKSLESREAESALLHCSGYQLRLGMRAKPFKQSPINLSRLDRSWSSAVSSSL